MTLFDYRRFLILCSACALLLTSDAFAADPGQAAVQRQLQQQRQNMDNLQLQMNQSAARPQTPPNLDLGQQRQVQQLDLQQQLQQQQLNTRQEIELRQQQGVAAPPAAQDARVHALQQHQAQERQQQLQRFDWERQQQQYQLQREQQQRRDTERAFAPR
jgi:hypothetical protein